MNYDFSVPEGFNDSNVGTIGPPHRPKTDDSSSAPSVRTDPMPYHTIIIFFGSVMNRGIVSAIDITIHDVQFYGMKLAGIILISIGFLLVMFPNNWPEYIFRLLR